MEFGEWVLEMRRQNKWNIRVFGDKTSLDSSTVNKIEKLYTQPTVYTAFRICEGVDVSLYDLMYILDGRKLQFLLKDNSNDDVVTIKDIEKVVDTFRQDRDKVINAMVSTLNELHQEIDSSKQNYQGRRRLDDEEIVSYTFRPYSTGEVHRLLFPSPLSDQYQLRYPTPIKIDLMTRVYKQNGALMLQDAETFLKKVKSVRPFTMSSSSPASMERIRLVDILQADAEGEQEGKLIGVYWEACRFFAAFSPFGKFIFRPRAADQQLSPLNDPESPNQLVEHEEWELRLATLYLMICRWEQFLGKTEHGLKLDEPVESVHQAS